MTEQLPKLKKSLAATHPALAKQAHGWDPNLVTPASHKKVEWVCELGHVWSASLGNRTAKRYQNGVISACPTCIGKQLLVGFNDLATTHPSIAAEAFGWDPKTATRGSARKVKWKCEFEHIWRATIGNRTAKEPTGCPTCAASGFDPNKPSWLYFIADESRGLLQIGITGEPEVRIEKHRKMGWEIISIRGPIDGYAARKLEVAILRSLKKRKAMLALSAGHKKFSGHTESWTKQSFKVSSLDELLKLVNEDEAI